MDYTKLQYEKQRKMKEARKHQRHTETKEVKLRPNIDEHDFSTKLAHLREFLLGGHKSKITLMFRAREVRRNDVGRQTILRMVEKVKDISTVESSSLGHGRMLVVLVTPTKEVLAEAERRFKEELRLKKQEHDQRLARKGGHEASAAETAADPAEVAVPGPQEPAGTPE